jgi:hypothetical protein
MSHKWLKESRKRLKKVATNATNGHEAYRQRLVVGLETTVFGACIVYPLSLVSR